MNTPDTTSHQSILVHCNIHSQPLGPKPSTLDPLCPCMLAPGFEAQHRRGPMRWHRSAKTTLSGGHLTAEIEWLRSELQGTPLRGARTPCGFSFSGTEKVGRPAGGRGYALVLAGCRIAEA